MCSKSETFNKIRKYERRYVVKNSSPFPVSEASFVFDALLAKNVEKRNSSLKNESRNCMQTRSKRKQTKQSRLPASPLNHDSFDIKINSTFDNLLQQPDYQPVKFKNVSSFRNNNSTEESSGHVSTEHISPYNTRKKQKKVYTKINVNKSSKVDSKGKVKTRKKSEKKKIVKSIKLTVNDIAGKNIMPDKPHMYSYLDKSMNYSLIIEKEVRHIPTDNSSQNANATCARKFTPISPNSKVLQNNVSDTNKQNSYIFKDVVQQRMRAQNAPKRMISSTPILPKTYLNIPTLNKMDDDISPIKNSSLPKVLYFDSKIENSNLLENKTSTKTDVKNINPMSTSEIILLDSIVSNENSSFKPISKPDLSESLFETDKTANNLSTKTKLILNDKKLTLKPVVVVEKYLDVLGISGNVSLQSLSSERTLNKSNIFGIKSFRRKYSPKVALDKVSLTFLKNQLQIKNSSNESLIDASKVQKTDKAIIISDDIIEISDTESITSFSNSITRKRKRSNSNTANSNKHLEVPHRFTLQEWEQFSRNNIGFIQIEQCEEDCGVECPTTKEANTSNSVYIVKSANSDDIIEDTINDLKSFNRQSVFLKPGKQWFRSLSILRNSGIHNTLKQKTSPTKGRKWRESVCTILNLQQEKNGTCLNNQQNEICNIKKKVFPSLRRTSVFKIVPIENEQNSLKSRITGYVSTLANESILESFNKLSLTTDVTVSETARQIVLKHCGQTAPIHFNDCYSQRILKKCRKIGEGVYGEVFMYKSPDSTCRVIKVIPVEGNLAVNGEHQKKFEEIISEIIIASELSNLRMNKEFCTDGYAELLKVSCVQGKYPQQLLDLWELYDEDHGSENDSPEIFNDDQLYIILELANGGQDMEAFRFNNAEQSYAIFVQVVCSLAAAESALEFEHRDMHWGNILISATEEPTKTFRLNGREFEVATKGTRATIIDFTLSRMTYNNCCIYNDLALDPDLFTATGDYQFDIYRLMKERNHDDWQRFEPYSNILWLDYTLDKMIKELRYLRITSRTHKTYMRRLSALRKKICNFNSATELLNSDVFSHVFL